MEIETEEKGKEVLQFAQSKANGHYGFAIGLQRLQSNWMWVQSGEEAKDIPWAPKNPSTASNSLCANVIIEGKYAGHYRSLPCTNRRTANRGNYCAVCELKTGKDHNRNKYIQGVSKKSMMFRWVHKFKTPHILCFI